MNTCERNAPHFDAKVDDVLLHNVQQQVAKVGQDRLLARGPAQPVTIVSDSDDDDPEPPQRFRVCSQVWLRNFFDDKTVIPYESCLVMVRWRCREPQLELSAPYCITFRFVLFRFVSFRVVSLTHVCNSIHRFCSSTSLTWV